MLWALAGKLLLAASKLKCLLSHTPGSGVCCGCGWHSNDEEGDCCGNVWHVPPDGEPSPDRDAVPFVPVAWPSDKCPSGHVYAVWGTYGECCGCLPEQVFDPRVQAMVNAADVLADLCCPTCPDKPLLPFDDEGNDVGCYMACCGLEDPACVIMREPECVAAGGTPQPDCCEYGCPIPCCSEDEEGVVSCESIRSGLCVDPKVPADPADCETGCKGQCCTEDEDGIFQPQGMMTQAACAEMGGKWAGLGKEDCDQCPCRDPFSCDCCESKSSTAAGLTFTQPRGKRHPRFSDTLRVVVTGRTESAILVHGMPVGAGCSFEVEFLLCWDEFLIEPVPCGTNFKKLDVTVCWHQHDHDVEELNFSGCDGLTINLGDCQYDCVTTLVYDQDESRSSDATLYTRNDATIRVDDGTIEFTGDIIAVAAQQDGSPCANDPRTLTLSGAIGKVSGTITNLPAGEGSVAVTVSDGEWWLSGANTFSGHLTVIGATLVVAADVAASGASPFGASTSLLPVLGDASHGATMILDDGVTVRRGFEIAAGSGTVVIGGRGGGTSDFTADADVTIGAGRDVTLQAGGGGTITFANSWSSGYAETMAFGSAGNAGTVILSSPLAAEAFSLDAGTVRLNGSGVPGFGILLGPSLDPPPTTIGGATLDLNGNAQRLDDLTFASSGGTITGGTLNLGTATVAATVDVSGTGHEIASAVVVANAATFDVDASSSVTVSGVMSGSGAVTITGSGTLTLTTANTYSGGTTISGATVSIGDDAALGTGGVTVTSGGVLNLNGHTIANTITNSGGTVNP